MATKAGRIQLKDIKQGRVFYKVLADFNIDGTPKILSVEPIYVTALAKRHNRDYILIGKKPRPKHHDWLAAEYCKYTDVKLNLRLIFATYQSQEVINKSNYSPIFISKRAADRFVKQFMLRHATPAELERVLHRHRMSQLGIEPRGHVRDMDYLRPLSFMPEPSAEVIAKWNAAFQSEPGNAVTEEEKQAIFKSADELTDGAFSKIFSAAAERPQYDWEGLKKTLKEVWGDRPHVTISATLPPSPASWGPRGEIDKENAHLFAAPVMRGYAEGIRRYADMIFNPISESGNPHTNPTLHFIRGKRRDPGVSVPYEVIPLPNVPLSDEIVNARTLGEVEIPFPPEHLGVNLDDWFRTHNPEAFKHMGGLKTDNDPHFYKGDQLKVIDNKDEDELCEGGLAMDEIVTMMDRSSQHRSHIIVQRANGREYQLEKRRFELYCRGGSKGKIVLIEEPSERGQYDPKGLIDFFAKNTPGVTEDPLENAAYRVAMANAPKIVVNLESDHFPPLNLYGDKKDYKPFPDINELPQDENGLVGITHSWDPMLDGMALMATQAGTITEEQYGLIRNRDDSTGFLTAFRELSRKDPGTLIVRTPGPQYFLLNFAAEHICGNWYVTTRDKKGPCGRIIDKEEYDRRMGENVKPKE